MIKVFAFFLGLMFIPLTTQATEYKEGTHFQIIKQTASATPEVTEFFSFYCGHCRVFEPFMINLKANLADGVAFKKNHVNFLGKEMGVQLTNAYAAAQLLQVEDKVAELLFDTIQIKQQQVDIIDIFEKAGISKKEARSALQSFPAKGLASQMKRETETFNIRGVPTVIVNGKYQVNRGSVKSEAEFIDLVNYLTQLQG